MGVGIFRGTQLYLINYEGLKPFENTTLMMVYSPNYRSQHRKIKKRVLDLLVFTLHKFTSPVWTCYFHSQLKVVVSSVWGSWLVKEGNYLWAKWRLQVKWQFRSRLYCDVSEHFNPRPEGRIRQKKMNQKVVWEGDGWLARIKVLFSNQGKDKVSDCS